MADMTAHTAMRDVEFRCNKQVSDYVKSLIEAAQELCQTMETIDGHEDARTAVDQEAADKLHEVVYGK